LLAPSEECVMGDRKENPATLARFNVEYMAMMLSVGRTEEAAEAYGRAREYAAEAADEIDRLREIAVDTSPLEELAALARH